MIRILRMKALYIASFLLFFLIFEFLTYSSVGMSGLSRFFLLDILIILFFTSIIYFFKSKKMTVILLSILMFFVMALYLVNAHMYLIFGDVFSFEYFRVTDEAGKVFSFSFVNIGLVFLGLLVYSLYILINVIISRHIKVKYDLEREYIVSGLFTNIFLSLIIGVFFSISLFFADNNTYINGKKVKDSSFIFTTTKKAFKHYGMLGLYYKEIEIDYFRDKDKEVEIKDDYLSNSEYEGLLKNKNVITIMCESLQNFSICEELTPNLYKLQEEGINFSNNYSVNKTNVSEMMGITGSDYPFYDTEYNVYFSIPNILNDTYKTTYVHDNNDLFYDRGKLVKYYGFENSYFHDDLYDPNYTSEIYPIGITGWENNDWHWSGDYTLDSVTMEMALPYLVDKDNLFYSFFTSLSMHGPYTGGINSNKQLFNRLGYEEKVRDAMENNKWVNPLENEGKYEDYLVYYECAVMDFDVAVGKLLKYLEDNDLLDDTLLVIYGDHMVYYHDIHFKIAKTTDISKVDKLYQTVLIMYNKKLNDKFYSKNNTHYETRFSSPFIVVPTILDLLGVRFNKECYANYSIFDERYLEVFYSYQQKAFMTNNFYSEDLETLRYVRDDKIDSKKFLDDANIFRDRIEYTMALYEKCEVDD